MTGRRRSVEGMRGYWDSRARENAIWYVDTSLDYDHPDMDRFLATGRAVLEDALDRAPVTPARTDLAVEIGSGLGRICLALADHFDRVVGVDISSEMIERAQELVDDPDVEFVHGDGSGLAPLPDACADLVMSFTVFQHIPDVKVVEGYVREAARVLRPGGLLAFQWNNQPGHIRWRARRAVVATLRRLRLARDVRQTEAPQFLGSRIPLRHIEAMLRGAGLELAGTRGEGSLFAWAWATRAGKIPD